MSDARTAATLERCGVWMFPWGRQRPSIEALVEMAQAAEEMGFGAVHVPWHFSLSEGWVFKDFGNRFLLDPLVVLPLLALRTSRIKIALNCGLLPLLHPFFWAQYLASLDVVSNGRVIAGMAQGWWREDFQVGLALIKERAARMDDGLEALSRLWAGERLGAGGRFWDLEGLRLDPVPVQPRLPIWLGAAERSIPRAVRWADYLCPQTPSLQEIRERFRIPLDAEAARHGRRVGLAAMNYVSVWTDGAPQSKQVMPMLLTCLEFDDTTTPPPDEDVRARVLCGTPEHCARVAGELFRAGLDSVVLDFQFHGLESIATAIRQMRRFVEEVAPSIDA